MARICRLAMNIQYSSKDYAAEKYLYIKRL